MTTSEIEGVECWGARELQKLLGYSKWENFEKVIQKAKESCKNAGEDIFNHFPDLSKTIPIPKGAEREIKEILLTRYACYLIAQNGDSRKGEIAFAQNYFAVQTRKAEVVGKRLENNLAVRKMRIGRMIIPENLPPAEDVMKVKRKLDNDNKKILKELTFRKHKN